jgi:uncharacterized repeat protein (TIGR03806 family)
MARAFSADRWTRAAWLVAALALPACTSHTSSAGTSPEGGQLPRDDAATLDAATFDAASGETGTADDGGSGEVTPAPEGTPYPTLSEWHLFRDAARQVPADHVIPYDVISPLFSDYTAKRRFLYVPAGSKIAYSPTDKWGLPVGSILVKTFSFLADARDPSKGERLLETRLLIHESSGWTPHTYVWNAEQTSATLKTGGDTIPSHFIDMSGAERTDQYTVPSVNDCRNCHGLFGRTDTLGGRTRQLDRDYDYGNGPENQIDHLAALGLFDKAPEPASARVHLVDPFGTAPLHARARSYFDANCGHCHQPGKATGSSSGYWLDYASTEPTEPKANWGFCKVPAAAGGATCGRQFDVVPGSPDESIIVCRLESTQAKVRMPSVGRNLIHAEGVALVRQWISGLAGHCGPSEADAGNPGTPPIDAGPGDAGGSADGAG